VHLRCRSLWLGFRRVSKKSANDSKSTHSLGCQIQRVVPYFKVRKFKNFHHNNGYGYGGVNILIMVQSLQQIKGLVPPTVRIWLEAYQHIVSCIITTYKKWGNGHGIICCSFITILECWGAEFCVNDFQQLLVIGSRRFGDSRDAASQPFWLTFKANKYSNKKRNSYVGRTVRHF
jgi:hypothetical protein